MARASQRRGRVRVCPANTAELRPWLRAVEDWRHTRFFETPRPRLLLDLVEPGAPWIWIVACSLERLEMEDISGIPFPLPSPTALNVAGPAMAEVPGPCQSEGSAPTPIGGHPTAESATTSDWLRILEEAMSGVSSFRAPNQIVNAMTASNPSAASPSTLSRTSTFPATIESEYSCFTPWEEGNSFDSYDCRPGVDAVRAYLAQQRATGEYCPLL